MSEIPFFGDSSPRGLLALTPEEAAAAETDVGASETPPWATPLAPRALGCFSPMVASCFSLLDAVKHPSSAAAVTEEAGAGLLLSGSNRTWTMWKEPQTPSLSSE